jgi:hypothetical protein
MRLEDAVEVMMELLKATKGQQGLAQDDREGCLQYNTLGDTIVARQSSLQCKTQQSCHCQGVKVR